MGWNGHYPTDDGEDEVVHEKDNEANAVQYGQIPEYAKLRIQSWSRSRSLLGFYYFGRLSRCRCERQ
jgi:hypothetical protein